MIKYPMDFNCEAHTGEGIQSIWQTQSEFAELPMSVPPEFEGPGGAFSPEDLFNSALANCFVATFKVYAEKSKLTFQELTVKSRLVVDFNEQRKPVMKDFYLSATIKTPSHPERALTLAKKASESGFILNSVKTTCHFEFHLS